MSVTTERANLFVRVPTNEAQAIKRTASQHGLTVNEYMRRTALGEPLGVSDTLQRIEALEQRLDRVEQLTFAT